MLLWLKLLLTRLLSRSPCLEITATMYPDNYSFRAFTRNPFTGEHGVGVYPASHYGRVPLTRPFELPKSDLAMAYENRKRANDMLDLTPETLY